MYIMAFVEGEQCVKVAAEKSEGNFSADLGLKGTACEVEDWTEVAGLNY